MSEEKITAGVEGGAATNVAPPAGLASATRRRALLKGLGKGAALAGAAVPLRGLATGSDRQGMRLNKSDGKGYHCTVSGNASVLASNGTQSLPVCVGKSCSYYKKTSSGYTSWPKNVNGQYVCIVGSTGYQPSTPFKTVFGSGPSTKIGDCVDASSPTDQSYWVAAMLNATVCSSTFPYSTGEVLQLYQDANRQASALAFFKTYLSGA